MTSQNSLPWKHPSLVLWSVTLIAAILAAPPALAQATGTDAESATDSDIADREAAADVPEDTGPPVTHLLGLAMVEEAAGRETQADVDASNREGESDEDEKSDNRGALVMEVDPLSPAWNAGIRSGDLILQLGGVKADSYEAFLDAARELVKERTEGEKIPVTVLREGKEMNLQIVEREAKKTELPDEPEQPRRDGAAAGGDSPRMQPGRPGHQQSGGLGPAGLGGDRRGGQQGAKQQDTDYYFGSGGQYGSALTSSQQNKLDRLDTIRNRDGLSNAQQRDYDQLLALENGEFGRLDPLDERGMGRLQELRREKLQGGEMSTDDRAELRQLMGRQLQRPGGGDLFAERRQLMEQSQLGQLSPEQERRLNQLDQLGPAPANRTTQDSYNQLRNLVGNGAMSNLSAEQQQRFQQLAARRGNLSQREQAELRRMQYMQEQQFARQLRGEYRRAQQMRQRGQQMSTQQRARFNQLQARQRMYQAGVANPGANLTAQERAAVRQQSGLPARNNQANQAPVDPSGGGASGVGAPSGATGSNPAGGASGGGGGGNASGGNSEGN